MREEKNITKKMVNTWKSKLPSKKVFFTFLILAVVSGCAYSFAQSTDNETPLKTPVHAKNDLGTLSKTEKAMNYVPGEVIVKFKPAKINLKTSGGQKNAQNFAISQNMKQTDTIANNNIVVLSIEGTESVEQKIVQLKSNANVEYAEPNYIYQIQSFNDTYSGNLRGLTQISGYQAFAIFSGNADQNRTGTIVAVVDLGVAYDHPDLTNQMRDGTNCKDENGNFLGSCIHGYDVVDDDQDPYPMDHAHGTHIAGTIAAEANNNRGILGVNYNARIMAIKVGNFNGLETTDIIQGINFARQNGAKIINASFGGTEYSSSMYDAINAFKSAGGIFVTAAGNATTNNDGGTHFYPCDYTLDNIICVAATNSSDDLAGFSNYGAASVDVGAPGVNIYSTIANIAETTNLSEDFESTTPGSIPVGWTQGGTSPNRGVYDLGGDRGGVLYSDLAYPYANNVNSTITKSLDISNASGIAISFRTMCDTEYSLTSWTDYMTLEASPNGTTWNEIAKRDEPYLDYPDTDPTGAAYAYLTYYLTGQQYLTSNFKFRFRWVTNASDNNYDGCLVDDVTVKTYTANTTGEPYGYMNGTSMATPHVVGLTSLAWSMRPDLNYQSIKSAILGSGDSLSSLSGKTVSGKRINAYKTLLALDNIPPTATVAYSTTGWTSGNVLATITGFSETITGLNTDNFVFTGNGSGTFIFFDLAGNTGSTTATVTWIDKTIPTATGSYSTTAPTNQDVLVILTGWSETLTGLTATGHTFTGNDSFTFIFSDLAGNTGSYTATVTWIDKTSLTGSIIFSTTGLTNQNVTATITGFNKTGVTVSGDNSYTFTNNGIYIFYYHDTYGNTGSATANITWIDKVPPTVTLVSPTSGQLFNTGTTYHLYNVIETGSAPVECTFYRSGGNHSFAGITPGTGIDAGHLSGTPDGTHRWYISCVDQIGNTGISAIQTFTIDTLAPSISTGTVTNTTSQTPTFTYTATESGTLSRSGSCSSNTLVAISGVNTITLGTLSNATYNGCYIRITDQANNTGSRYNLPVFTINYTVPSGGGGGGGGGTPTCTLPKLVCTGGKYELKDGENCQGGNLGNTCSISGSITTGSIITGGAIIDQNGSGGGGSILGSTYSSELNDAYIFAYTIGITTQPTIQQADLADTLIRKHLAKMISNFAIKQLGQIPNTGLVCSFTDMDDESIEMKFYAKTACQLGLMGLDVNGVPISTFNPNGKVTRAQFGTVLSRALYGDLYNRGTPYYLNHLNALKINNIITNTDPSLQELRGYVMLMLMRAID